VIVLVQVTIIANVASEESWWTTFLQMILNWLSKILD
jgi:hypothetical protein